MSSLQKFHRRTNAKTVNLIGSEAPIADSGFWLGTAGNGTSKLIVAPKSTEVKLIWGSAGTSRNVTSTTDGLANTNTLYSFGSGAHPMAYYCKTLTQGGYNTWYLPAKDELNTCYSNRLATPFATNNQYSGNYYQTSTEYDSNACWGQSFGDGTQGRYSSSKGVGRYFRAVRRAIY